MSKRTSNALSQIDLIEAMSRFYQIINFPILKGIFAIFSALSQTVFYSSKHLD